MAIKRALLIGINYYNTPDQLNGCINDTVNMRNMLIDAYHYDPQNITMLRDDQANAALLPTRANIMTQLKILASLSGTSDEIWIHYSGHGSQIRDRNGDEMSGMDDVIVPVDYNVAGFIVDDDLFTIIRGIKCRAIMLFDSCHSGTVCDLPWAFDCRPGTMFMRNRLNSPLLPNQNIYMFSGCKDNQTSADTYNDQTSQYVGAFTDAFLECLRLNGHQMPILALHRAVCARLSATGYSQVPLFSSTNATPAYALSRFQSVQAIAQKPTQKPAAKPIASSVSAKKSLSMVFV